MRTISNAMLEQAEIVLTNRWDYGPLELVFLPQPADTVDNYNINGWNRHHRAGFIRHAREVETVCRLVPRLEDYANPNVFLVPEVGGFTELHRALASVVHPSILRRHQLRKESAVFWLWPAFPPDRPARFAAAAERAFAEYIWPRLTSGRGRPLDFAPNSPLRLLASDARFWMQRLYRIALARAEEIPPVEQRTEDDWWQPIDELWAHLRKNVRGGLPTEVERHVRIDRPLYGGTLWDVDDQRQCDAVVDEMLRGRGVLESLEPVLEVIHSHRTPEDFSDRFSWIKTDFERTFHSRRRKFTVTMIETYDDVPAWSADDFTAYENVLFRDILALFDQRDRRLILALRQGKTVSEIARDNGLTGHAAISRRVRAIKAKVRQILDQE